MVLNYNCLILRTFPSFRPISRQINYGLSTTEETTSFAFAPKDCLAVFFCQGALFIPRQA